MRDLLQDATRADALLLRLALADQALGSPELAAHVQSCATASPRRACAATACTAAKRRASPSSCLAQPQAALALARDNWEVQREPWDARILLEAAVASGDRAARRSRCSISFANAASRT